MYYELPSDMKKAKPLLQRFLQENLASSQLVWAGGRRRPLPIRSLTSEVSSPNVILRWKAPQNIAGVQGFNIYEGTGNNRIANINNAQTEQYIVARAGALPLAFYVSCYTALLESIKVGIVVT